MDKETIIGQLVEATCEHGNAMYDLGKGDPLDMNNPERKQTIKHANHQWAIICNCIEELRKL